MIICFIYLTKMFFSAKAILEFFQLLNLNFNLEQYVRKKLHIFSFNCTNFIFNVTISDFQSCIRLEDSIIDLNRLNLSKGVKSMLLNRKELICDKKN